MLTEIKIKDFSELKKGDKFLSKTKDQIINPSYYEFIQVDKESVEIYSLDSNLKRNSARCWVSKMAFNVFIKYEKLFMLREENSDE